MRYTHLSFDLDGVCTCIPDGGPDTCKPNGAPPQRCDNGNGGEDNSGQALLKQARDLGKLDFQQAANDSFGSGGRSILITVASYNGLADDPNVLVGVLISPGLVDVDGNRIPPKHDKRDQWSVDDSTAVAGNQGVILPLVSKQAYVVNHTLVVDNIDIALPIAQVGNVTLRSAVFVAKLGDDPAGGYTLTEVSFAGRWSIAEATRVAGSFEATVDGGPICDKSPATFGLLKQVICSAADLRADSKNDPMLPCNAISIAVRATLVPASLGKLITVPVTRNCENAVNDCAGDGG